MSTPGGENLEEQLQKFLQSAQSDFASVEQAYKLQRWAEKQDKKKEKEEKKRREKESKRHNLNL